MRRNHFVLAFAIGFAWATICACSNKDKGSSEATAGSDTEEVDEVAEEKEEEETASEYLSHDLATFDLYGQVRSATYELSGHDGTVVVKFDAKGQVTSVARLSDEGAPELAEIIKVSGSDRIDFVGFESDAPWLTAFSYDDNAKGFTAPTLTTETNQMGNYTGYTYKRDDDGRLKSAQYEEAVHGNIVTALRCPITTRSYDRYGNWQECTIKQGDATIVYKRKLVYHTAETAKADEEAKKQEEQAIKAFITDMYNNGRYMDYDFLRQHCTQRMLAKLEEEYEYDGEGYAVWLFRTSAQDGKPGAKEGSKVISIKPDTSYYRYKFYDQGWLGENKILVFCYEGNCYIDDVKRVYDEAAEAN